MSQKQCTRDTDNYNDYLCPLTFKRFLRLQLNPSACSYFFRNTLLSCTVIIISMLLADIFIGFYKNIFFVYLSLLLITYIFSHINRKIKLKNLFIFGLLGSVIFFILSNFGVWILSEMYEKNLNGLINCYLLAVPFFINTLLSTIIFSYTAFLTKCFYYKEFA